MSITAPLKSSKANGRLLSENCVRSFLAPANSQSLRPAQAFASKVKMHLFGSGILINAPTGLRPPAKGCRFGYPGNQ